MPARVPPVPAGTEPSKGVPAASRSTVGEPETELAPQVHIPAPTRVPNGCYEPPTHGKPAQGRVRTAPSTGNRAAAAECLQTIRRESVQSTRRWLSRRSRQL